MNPTSHHSPEKRRRRDALKTPAAHEDQLETNTPIIEQEVAHG